MEQSLERNAIGEIARRLHPEKHMNYSQIARVERISVHCMSRRLTRQIHKNKELVRRGTSVQRSQSLPPSSFKPRAQE
jgi:hypothetical protein